MSDFKMEHNRLFDNLENALNNDLASIAVEANGGRSILFVYPNEDDDKYIEEGKQRLGSDRFVFIDIREALTEYINNIGKETFDEMYENFGKEVYRSENSPKGTFFFYLMEKIGEVLNADKSPVLVHTGTLYDLDIQNIHIMEDEIVLRAKRPLVVFYPATIVNGQIFFLGKVPASHYRCIVIQ